MQVALYIDHMFTASNELGARVEAAVTAAPAKDSTFGRRIHRRASVDVVAGA